jgi:hypothetical protein
VHLLSLFLFVVVLITAPNSLSSSGKAVKTTATKVLATVNSSKLIKIKRRKYRKIVFENFLVLAKKGFLIMQEATINENSVSIHHTICNNLAAAEA